MTASTDQVEFGDFQTPDTFARVLVSLLPSFGIHPETIIEPTCGVGGFLVAANDIFPSANLIGVEINPYYAEIAKGRLGSQVAIREIDFFSNDWLALVEKTTGKLLFLGNPPWVTNSQLGKFGGANLPSKSNLKGLRGVEAVTGKANFDISEWMLIKLLEVLQVRGGTMAMLCKTSVARKILKYASDKSLSFHGAKIISIDANAVFGAAVDACFFIFHVGAGPSNYRAEVYSSPEARLPQYVIGVDSGQLVSNVELYLRSRYLDGKYKSKWRSGVKHDCSKVMEFTLTPNGLKNGFEEIVDLETEFLFPLLKSSDLANSRILIPRKQVLVTQTRPGEATDKIEQSAPKTWKYLLAHGAALDRRQSSIYKNKPRFSIFGIGDYSFAPWKVAISGFYKSLKFQIIPPMNGKPVMLDDTCYFLSCESDSEARELCRKLCSVQAQDFLNSVIFWDAKRPHSTDILQRLDLDRIETSALI